MVTANRVCKDCKENISDLQPQCSRCKPCQMAYRKKAYKQRCKTLKYKRRGLANIELFPNAFPNEEVDSHHIADAFVLKIPKKVHQEAVGNSREVHRELLKSFIEKNYNFTYIIIENKFCINCKKEISNLHGNCKQCLQCRTEYAKKKCDIYLKGKEEVFELLGTTDFKAHREKDFSKEAAAIKKEMKELGLR